MRVRKEKLQACPIFISIYHKVFFNSKKMMEKSHHRLDISGLSFPYADILHGFNPRKIKRPAPAAAYAPPWQAHRLTAWTRWLFAASHYRLSPQQQAIVCRQ